METKGVVTHLDKIVHHFSFRWLMNVASLRNRIRPVHRLVRMSIGVVQCQNRMGVNDPQVSEAMEHHHLHVIVMAIEENELHGFVMQIGPLHVQSIFMDKKMILRKLSDWIYIAGKNNSVSSNGL